MKRRGLLIGGLGMSLSLAGAGVINAVPTLAQESSATFEDLMAEREEERLQRYEDFLARFTANLGLSDPVQVETAYKDTLKELIDEQLAAGDISANAATELKARIDEASGPVLFGGGGRERRLGIVSDRQFQGGRGGRRGGLHRPGQMSGDWPGSAGGVFETETAGDDDTPNEVESLPATDDAEATPAS